MKEEQEETIKMATVQVEKPRPSLDVVIGEVKSSEMVDVVARLADKIWHEYYSSIMKNEQIDYMVKTFQSKEAVERAIKNNDYRYFLVQSDSLYGGYFALVPSSDEIFISKLYLMDWARGKGIGRAIMSYVEELAKKKGIKKLWLTVNRGNTDSIEVYKKLGFIISESTVTEIGNGFVMDDHIMRKTLA